MMMARDAASINYIVSCFLLSLIGINLYIQRVGAVVTALAYNIFARGLQRQSVVLYVLNVACMLPFPFLSIPEGG